ncbi:hypothetical protein [Burkholderia ubonensis]|uniref:hypothetical protein n=1 Tax=Burkholderia ubonensis TaxID=101571 RepID=UPI0012F9BDEE|nr:hypothetical protein [Burkholderia ubonensis]
MAEKNDIENAPAGTSQPPEIAQTTENLVAELFHEVNTSPPWQCPLNYTGPGTEEEVRQAAEMLKIHAVLLRREHPWLYFDSLDAIVFHSDYALALREISERAGRPCEATRESTGAGVAMVVHLDEKCVAVLEAGLLLGLLDTQNEKFQSLCIDLVRHELCHVYDYGRLLRLLPHEFLRKQVDLIDRHVFTAAHAAWSEYFANKYSHSGHSDLELHPKYLADVVPSVVGEVHAAIRSYRTEADLNKLLPFCQQKVTFLLQCFGYAAGRLTAAGASLDEVAPNSVAALKHARLWDVWLSVAAELDRLDACREAWASFNELRALMSATDAVYKTLGLHYRLTDAGQLYVDIPHTPETTPPHPLAQLLARRG